MNYFVELGSKLFFGYIGLAFAVTAVLVLFLIAIMALGGVGIFIEKHKKDILWVFTFFGGLLFLVYAADTKLMPDWTLYLLLVGIIGIGWYSNIHDEKKTR